MSNPTSYGKEIKNKGEVKMERRNFLNSVVYGLGLGSFFSIPNLSSGKVDKPLKEFYSPIHTPVNWSIPTKRKEVYSWCRFFSTNDAEVASIVSYYANEATKRISKEHSGVDKNKVREVVRDLLVLGDVFVDIKNKTMLDPNKVEVMLPPIPSSTPELHFEAPVPFYHLKMNSIPYLAYGRGIVHPLLPLFAAEDMIQAKLLSENEMYREENFNLAKRKKKLAALKGEGPLGKETQKAIINEVCEVVNLAINRMVTFLK